MHAQHEYLEALEHARVRCLLAGASAANFWARDGAAVLRLAVHEVLVEPRPEELARAWRAFAGLGYTLRADARRFEPADAREAEGLARAQIEADPGQDRLSRAYRLRDRVLVEIRTHGAPHGFDVLWRERRTFYAHGLRVEVPRLGHVLDGLRARGHPHDVLVLETWREEARVQTEPDPVAAAVTAAQRARRAADKRLER